MLWDASAIKGYAIKASDGQLGVVSDFLFADDGWRIKWLVVDTGKWLPGRLVLVHPGALGQPDAARRQFPVALTKQQVEDSPSISTDQPVSRQMEARLYNHYGWDPAWGETHFQAGAISSRLVPPPYLAGASPHDVTHNEALSTPQGDPHLRSIAAVRGYVIHAKDGAIGLILDFLFDDTDWSLRYIKADTGTWWSGTQVLLAPAVVRSINSKENTMSVDLTRSQIQGSPKYDSSMTVDGAYENALISYYGW